MFIWMNYIKPTMTKWKNFQTNLITLGSFSPRLASSVITVKRFSSRSVAVSLSLFLCKTSTISKIVMFTLCLQWELLHLAQLEKKVSCVIFEFLSCAWFLISLRWLPVMVPIPFDHHSWIFTSLPSYSHPVPYRVVVEMKAKGKTNNPNFI